MRWVCLLLFVLLIGCNTTTPVASPVPPVHKAETSSVPAALSSQSDSTTLPVETYYKNKVLVLLYHHVDDTFVSPYTITSSQFREHIAYLREHHYNPISWSQFITFMETGELPVDNAVLLTFDDGYESMYKEVLHVLREANLPAVSFVVGETLRDSVDRKRPGLIPPLTHVELEQLTQSELISVQSHSYSLNDQEDKVETAPIMKQKDQVYRSKLFVDFTLSKKAIEAVTKQPVMAISYPSGYTNKEVIQAAKQAGFTYGFTSTRGIVTPTLDHMHLPRLEVGKTDIDVNTLDVLIKETVSDKNRK